MTDLDIEIDVPDDDGLDSSVRVLNGNWIPPWMIAAGVLISGALVVLLIAAFVLGRMGDGPTAPTSLTVPTTPLASAPASPAIENALTAVAAWERFARTGDRDELATAFATDGPQYAMLISENEGAARSVDVDFSARNLTEASADGVTTVSMDLVVSSVSGQDTYPFDLVYLDDADRVWTVVDRRAPGEVALPPSADVVDAVSTAWGEFVAAITTGDGDAAAATVSDGSRELADQLVAVAAGGPRPDVLALSDADLFDLLVERARATGTDRQGMAVIGALDESQQAAIRDGTLTSWTQIGPDRVVATLLVDDRKVATVPFVATAEKWAFDLVAALENSGGDS